MESTVTLTVEEYNTLKDSADQNRWKIEAINAREALRVFQHLNKVGTYTFKLVYGGDPQTDKMVKTIQAQLDKITEQKKDVNNLFSENNRLKELVSYVKSPRCARVNCLFRKE